MLMGEGDPDVALRVLRKYNGNMDKAADALLAGETGEEQMWVTQQPATVQPQDTSVVPHGTAAPRGTPQASVIDLTGDNDDEFSRALQMSLTTAPNEQEPKFGPSDRAPDPNWQMVPSNVAIGQQVPTVSQEEQNLNDAIKASLDDFAGDEADDYPPQNAVREDGRPLVLRSDTPALAYAAQALHALFFVPQVRSAIANLRLPETNPAFPRHSSDRAIWNLVEMFSHMDLAKLAVICDTELLPSLDAIPCKEPGDEMVEASANFLRKVGAMVESYLNTEKPEESHPDCRLFTFIYGEVEFSPNRPRRVTTQQNPGDIVLVNIGGPDNPHNDIISSLVAHLSRYEESKSIHEVIIEPSEFVAFRLKRSPTTQAGVKVAPEPFVYSKTIYLDQFLLHNVELVVKNRMKERDIMREIKSYQEKRDKLTRLDNRDVLKDLQSSIYYYEHLADSRDDPTRKDELDKTAEKLKSILTIASRKVEEIDQHIELLTREYSEIFNSPELQKYRYDLRAVLMHTGLPGRKQMYSYVQDGKGTWWKTQDYTVTEASLINNLARVHEEVVLTDSTALHLNAGPYLLLYSRHTEQQEINAPLPWPEVFVNSVNENNQTLLQQWETLAGSNPPNYALSFDSQNINSPNVMDLSVD
ncbi:hypothetical protein BDQ17DRAFT_1420208 [Cyathus striatus]|nr:hypothetical protein BDQ17DRAFT_1420208 [Cyathus striatus]